MNYQLQEQNKLNMPDLSMFFLNEYVKSRVNKIDQRGQILLYYNQVIDSFSLVSSIHIIKIGLQVVTEKIIHFCQRYYEK